jgi:hypothetical protein
LSYARGKGQRMNEVVKDLQATYILNNYDREKPHTLAEQFEYMWAVNYAETTYYLPAIGYVFD